MGRENEGFKEGLKNEIDRKREAAEKAAKLQREVLRGTPAPGLSIALFKWRF